MEEIWKQIDDGYEQYQISTFGRVKSLKRKSEKILSLDKDRNGYMKFSHWSESVIAYKNKIQNRYKKGENYYLFLNRIKYASDPLYIQRIKKVVNNLKL